MYIFWDASGSRAVASWLHWIAFLTLLLAQCLHQCGACSQLLEGDSTIVALGGCYSDITGVTLGENSGDLNVIHTYVDPHRCSLECHLGGGGGHSNQSLRCILGCPWGGGGLRVPAGCVVQWGSTELEDTWGESGGAQSGEPSATISHHQPPSATISHHQPPSATISHHQPPSATISHHQPPSATISHHQPSSATISHHQPPSATISHH
jgi:hypothetical protein